MDDLISIIIPVYNAEKWLQRCIDSILNQTFSHFELLLIDDGSTDRSGEICDLNASRDERVRVCHQKNGGVSIARNTGIEMAEGDLISFIDADDYVRPEFLETLLRLLNEHGADISACDFWWIKEGEKTEPVKEPFVKVSDEPLSYFEHVSWACGVVVWNKLYRRRLFKTRRFLEEALHHQDEWIIHYLLNDAKRIVYTNEKLYVYLKYDTSLVHSETPSSYYDGYEALMDRVRMLEEKGMISNRNLWLGRTLFQLVRSYKGSRGAANAEFWLPVFIHRMMMFLREHGDVLAEEDKKSFDEAEELIREYGVQ